MATVNADGVVEAKSKGQTVITATYGNVSATCEVVVDKSTGAEMIQEDSAESRYFTLDGVEVSGDALIPGIYVRVANGRSEKVIVK